MNTTGPGTADNNDPTGTPPTANNVEASALLTMPGQNGGSAFSTGVEAAQNLLDNVFQLLSVLDESFKGMVKLRECWEERCRLLEEQRETAKEYARKILAKIEELEKERADSKVEKIKKLLTRMLRPMEETIQDVTTESEADDKGNTTGQ